MNLLKRCFVMIFCLTVLQVEEKILSHPSPWDSGLSHVKIDFFLNLRRRGYSLCNKRYDVSGHQSTSALR